MYPVVAVLPVCGRSQVRFAIIEAFMVDMIDVKMVGRVENLAVHLNMLPLVFSQMNPPDGIIGVFALICVPFVFVQALEILRIDDGVFALSERYPPKGVAVAQPTVQ